LYVSHQKSNVIASSWIVNYNYVFIEISYTDSQYRFI